MIAIMKRTQVQLPEPLYEKAIHVAKVRDWSLSEVCRRALEQYVSESSITGEDQQWTLPEPRAMGEEKVGYEHWRDISAADQERGIVPREVK